LFLNYRSENIFETILFGKPYRRIAKKFHAARPNLGRAAIPAKKVLSIPQAKFSDPVYFRKKRKIYKASGYPPQFLNFKFL